MNDALAVALAVLSPALLGWGVLRCVGLRPRDDALGWCGWWLFASLVATASLAGAWLALGGGSHRGVLVAGALLAVCAHLATTRRRRAGGETTPSAEPAHVERGWRAERIAWRATVAALLVLAVGSAVGAHDRALVVGDDAAFWAPKAKLLYLAGTPGHSLDALTEGLRYPEGYWRAFENRVERAEASGVEPPTVAADLPANTHHATHLDYPSMNPLLQWWCFVAAGRLLDGSQRIPLQLSGIALLLLLASALRRITRPGVAAVLLVLVAGLPQSSGALRSAYADGLVACGLLLCVDALRRAPRLTRSQWCLLATLGLTALVGAKNEGALYALVLLGALAVHLRARLRELLPWLVAPALWVVGTQVFNRLHGFENDLVGGFSPQLDRVGPVLTFFWEQVWSAPLLPERRADLNTNGLLLLALLTWCARLRPARDGWSAVAGLTLALVSLVHLAVYVATPRDLEWHLPTSAVRISWHLVPLAALWLAALVPRAAEPPPR